MIHFYVCQRQPPGDEKDASLHLLDPSHAIYPQMTIHSRSVVSKSNEHVGGKTDGNSVMGKSVPTTFYLSAHVSLTGCLIFLHLVIGISMQNIHILIRRRYFHAIIDSKMKRRNSLIAVLHIKVEFHEERGGMTSLNDRTKNTTHKTAYTTLDNSSTMTLGFKMTISKCRSVANKIFCHKRMAEKVIARSEHSITKIISINWTLETAR